LFEGLKQHYGDTEGTRQMLQVLLLHRDHDAAAVHQAVAQALDLGCGDAGAIAVLVRQQGACPAPPAGVADLGALARYGQTCPESLHIYDGLRPSQAVEVTYDGPGARA
jgi:hypothetical protein